MFQKENGTAKHISMVKQYVFLGLSCTINSTDLLKLANLNIRHKKIFICVLFFKTSVVLNETKLFNYRWLLSVCLVIENLLMGIQQLVFNYTKTFPLMC